LLVATKVPWPPIDGGRLLVRNTLEGLAARGHRLTVVAPASRREIRSGSASATLGEVCRLRLVASRPRPLLEALLRSRLSGRPLSIERHLSPAVRREVARLLAEESFDVIHAEQLQALAQAEPGFARSVAVLLRAENVECDIWRATASVRPGFGWLAQREAARMEAWEGRSVARVAATAALTEKDARRLGELAGGRGEIRVIRAPFASTLPAGEEVLSGSPAVVLMGSEGWLPNLDGVRWFARQVWPVVRQELPQARLHLFGRWDLGGRTPAIEEHSAPADICRALSSGSILAVPLRIASGVRIRILDAWARGVPVVATPEAAAGLDAEDGRELLLARDGREFAAAFARLAAEPDLARRLTALGREALARSHDPASSAAELEGVYRWASRSRSSAS